MEYLNEFMKYVNLPYLVVFMCITYALKDELNNILNYIFGIIGIHVAKIWTVFLIGTLTAVPFWFFFGHDKVILLITWAVGTSLHDMIIRFVIGWIKILIRQFKKKNGTFPVEESKDIKE